MGVIEDTGAAQFWRDVRVTSIYEGTNGIQALDLVGRKLADGGDAAFRLLKEVEDTATAARPRFPAQAEAVWDAAQAVRDATDWMLAEPDMAERGAGAAAYLQAFALVLGGVYHLRAALADDGDRAVLMQVFVARRLPQVAALLAAARAGAADLYALDLGDADAAG